MWQQQLPVIEALFGPLLGVALAFGYIGCVANMQRWFPDFKGLAAGVTGERGWCLPTPPCSNAAPPLPPRSLQSCPSASVLSCGSSSAAG